MLAHDESHRGKGGSYWLCRCACGAERRVHGGNLRKGLTRSCGCLKRELQTTHGYSRKPSKAKVYRIWNAMRQRCQNPNNTAWLQYGARGVRVCERWQRFENFLADMGEPPGGMSLDRINPAGNYEPGNCRWADQATQTANRRTTRQLAIEDLTVEQLQALLAKKLAASGNGTVAGAPHPAASIGRAHDGAHPADSRAPAADAGRHGGG